MSGLHIRSIPRVSRKGLTALTSPRFPLRAKCALRLALALPAQTPQSALSTLEKLSTTTRSGFGNAGLRQSMTMAVSLKISAARRYILHSGSRAVPSRCAKRMVPRRPVDSWRTESSSAVVGDAVESPTPTPVVCIRSGNKGVLYQRLLWAIGQVPENSDIGRQDLLMIRPSMDRDRCGIIWVRGRVGAIYSLHRGCGERREDLCTGTPSAP
jgi:hypothetical protein